MFYKMYFHYPVNVVPLQNKMLFFVQTERNDVQYLTLQLLSVNNYCLFVVSLKNNRFSVCGFQ